MVLNKDLSLKRVPTIEEAIDIVNNFRPDTKYLLGLYSEFISDEKEQYPNGSLLVNAGRFLLGVSKRTVAEQKEGLKDRIPEKQLSLFQ